MKLGSPGPIIIASNTPDLQFIEAHTVTVKNLYVFPNDQSCGSQFKAKKLLWSQHSIKGDNTRAPIKATWVECDHDTLPVNLNFFITPKLSQFAHFRFWWINLKYEHFRITIRTNHCSFTVHLQLSKISTKIQILVILLKIVLHKRSLDWFNIQ